jgi:predicted RNA-binding protein with TRAM domain
MGSWPAALPSEYTPEDQIVTELFKVGTEPTEVSTKYAKLSDVTNLTGTVSGNKLTLKWTAIETPDAISESYLSKYASSLYTDESYKSSAYNTLLSTNLSTFGSLVYKVYGKNSNGELSFIKETSDTSIEIDVTSDSPTTYVVKSSYTIFTKNASDGATVTVSLKDVKAKITPTLTVKETVEVNKGEAYKISTSDVKVMADSKDVTNDSKITYTIDNKNETTIDTTKVGTHTIKYTIVYNNETYTLSRTVKVVESTEKTS